ncbi:GntR family transcriptional regulator [Bartonella sp. HY038]|uniref:GntR family transcriptional regulator n=1 Tax=Bartonella sp. HY038 TaxID=2759660 RepID=UPI0015FAC025|nr:GntR family transcriptional regulator [Bartonella sp. HY038]
MSEKFGGDEQTVLLSERIRNALSDEITDGTLPPGSDLDEQQLAIKYGVSRTPVREALRHLEANGLAEKRGRRGLIVTPLTAERIMDMFEATAEIEAVCVRLATYRMTPLERCTLMELHEQSHDMVINNKIDDYDRMNRKFHEKIYHATHNRFLEEQAIAIRSKLSAFRRLQLHENNRISRSRQEHDMVMQAISQGDGEKAALYMRAHMLNAATALAHYIEQRINKEAT